MEPHTIKCEYNGQFKRFKIKWPSSNIYHHLLKSVENSWGFQLKRNLVLCYKDEDGENILCENDSELTDAFEYSNGVLNIYIVKDARKGQTGSSSSKGLSEQNKMLVRKGLKTAEAILDMYKTEPVCKLTVVPDNTDKRKAAVLSLTSRGPPNYTMTCETPGFGMNANTGKAVVQVVGFLFEVGNALAEM